MQLRLLLRLLHRRLSLYSLGGYLFWNSYFCGCWTDRNTCFCPWTTVWVVARKVSGDRVRASVRRTPVKEFFFAYVKWRSNRNQICAVISVGCKTVPWAENWACEGWGQGRCRNGALLLIYSAKASENIEQISSKMAVIMLWTPARYQFFFTSWLFGENQGWILRKLFNCSPRNLVCVDLNGWLESVDYGLPKSA